ncbi:hypothetical protein ACFXPX_13490 [Kitasatospora sp. NPDC059146]|uniref:hypothetical protein n=1 Tax=Kitasatospora sp. NPDC059146 TaxID=3346741 RepID=UPI0036999E72
MTDDQKAATSVGDSTGEGVDLDDEVHYPPVENALDYLVSVVEHLQGEEVGRRELKYAVVHLQAAVECLLKYRLEQEHWSLVFKNPGEAKRSELDDGSLSSCTVEQTLTRLTDIAGVAIGEGEKAKLKQLARLRNQLQHYGRPHNAKVNRYVIEANAAQVLEFLIRFLNVEVMPHMAPPDWGVAEDLYLIREGLKEIRGYVKARLHRLRPELEPVKARTVGCLSCRQLAMVIGEGEKARCLYCHHWDLSENIAYFYTQNVRDRSNEWLIANFELRDVAECPTCQAKALVHGARTAADPGTRVDLCFHCGGTTTREPA